VEQSGLTVITAIRPGRLAALRRSLATIGATIPFQNMSTVHYAAFLLLPCLDDCPQRLVLETNYDGDLCTHLDELITHGAPALDEIYDSCEDYPPAGATGDAAGVKQYFKNHSVTSSAFFVAFLRRSLGDIRNAIEVYREAKRFLDGHTRTRPSVKQTTNQVWKELVEHFRSRSPVRPQRSPVTGRKLKRLRWLNLLFLVAVVFVLPALAIPLLTVLFQQLSWRFAIKLGARTLLAVLVFILLIVGALLLVARLCEIIEARCSAPHDPTVRPVDQAVYDGLNVGPQNHLCTLATMRTSRLRMFMVKMSLLVVKVVSSRFFILGNLGSISTIHFARWILIDKGKRLLFLSNYDGSWSGYLSDFSDQGFGINAIWGNTVGFLPTKWMLWGGAYYLEPFEDSVLRHFQPAELFYTAYGEYPVQNLKRYLDYRDALAEALA
jgi:hypothetical protein